MHMEEGFVQKVKNKVQQTGKEEEENLKKVRMTIKLEKVTKVVVFEDFV